MRIEAMQKTKEASESAKMTLDAAMSLEMWRL
jgi:hypothetical protein